METLMTFVIFFALLLLLAVPYWIRAHRQRKQAVESQMKSAKADLLEPATLHPRIDVLACIGCGSCVRACPEDVLGIVEGRAAIVNGARCVGHGLCVDACPVSAIALGFGKPKQGMEIPFYDDHFQTNIPGMYIVGELGGIGLIRNAFEQGIRAVEHIAAGKLPPSTEMFDLLIVGAGPAGIAAALAAKSRGLRYLAFEQYELGGSLLHYPRKKVILTSPVELPLFGKLKYSEISKEELLSLFENIVHQFRLNVSTQQKVEAVSLDSDSLVVRTANEQHRARNVILAIGRRGSPRKLHVAGENLPKVAYRLIETESYVNKRLLIVGGGDSAIEAAVGLARQKGNDVTLSYRREAFVRLKEKNEKHIRAMIESRQIRVLFNSQITEIFPDHVIIQEGKNVIHKIDNDNVFIFAGGELPSEFLKKIGVQLRTREFEARVA